MINPMLRTVAEIREVAGAEFPEAARWAAIHLHTYKRPGLPAGVAAIMEKGGDWLKVDDYALQVCVESYLQDRATPSWQKQPPLATIKGKEFRTPAQFLAIYGSTESCCVCYGLSDLLQTLSFVGSYNNFDVSRALVELGRFNRLHYYNPGNPNNGGDAFTYHFAWEGTHALYIDCNTHCGLKVLSGNRKQWRTYTLEDFARDCAELGGILNADESWTTEKRDEWLTWRLWWD